MVTGVVALDVFVPVPLGVEVCVVDPVDVFDWVTEVVVLLVSVDDLVTVDVGVPVCVPASVDVLSPT